MRLKIDSIPVFQCCRYSSEKRKLVQIKKKKDGNGRNFMVAMSLYFLQSKLYVKNHIKIVFSHLVADNFLPSDAGSVSQGVERKISWTLKIWQ